LVRLFSSGSCVACRTKVDDRHFDRLVRNVYKVLLTRGMQSMRIYSTDPPTRDFLRRLVGG
jgi:DUF2075 family protein